MTETSVLSCVRFVSQHNKRYVPTIFCEALEVRRNDAFRVKLGGFVAMAAWATMAQRFWFVQTCKATAAYDGD